MKTFALLAVLLAADAPRDTQRPVLPPRDPHPFGAIETRPLWERPPAWTAREFTLQQRVEDALDRGTGRIEDEAIFQLRLLERNRLGDRPFDLTTPAGRDEYERFRLERDRQERLEERRMRLERAARRQRRIERESETLAEVRRRWAEQVDRENHAGGAVVDRQGLEMVEREYRAALEIAANQHAAALAAIEADQALTADERAARRAAAGRALEEARAAAARRWEERRKAILGHR